MNPEPGAKLNSDAAQTAINARLPNGNITIQTYITSVLGMPMTHAIQSGDIMGLDLNTPQLVTVPIVNWANASGAPQSVQIQGFALIWLQSINLKGSSATITAQYVTGLSSIATAGGDANNYGAQTPIHLIQ